MSPINSPVIPQQGVELSPNYTIPLVLMVTSIPLVFLNPWISLILGIFSVFLTVQTAIIRLKFAESSLEVYRSGKLIRDFPYSEWQNWRIFWNPVPILFYFKEIKSIHFLPIIFDAKTLKSCLEKSYPLEN